MGKRSAFFLSYNERVLRSCNGMATPCATTSPYNCLDRETPHSHHIAARRFRSTADRVLGKFCSVNP